MTQQNEEESDPNDVVEFTDRAPLIKLEPVFYESNKEEQIRYLHKLASTMNHAADLLQKERNKLLSELEYHKNLSKNSQAQIDIQKTINNNLILTMNEQTQNHATKSESYVNQINELKIKLKDLE